MHRCCPSVRLSVRLSVAKMRTKNKQFFSKTKQFRAMVSIYDLSEDLHGLFIEPITGPLKFKMADGRHFANRKIIAIISTKHHPVLNRFIQLVQSSTQQTRRDQDIRRTSKRCQQHAVV